MPLMLLKSKIRNLISELSPGQLFSIIYIIPSLLSFYISFVFNPHLLLFGIFLSPKIMLRTYFLIIGATMWGHMGALAFEN